MTNIRNIHREAMELVKKADRALSQSDYASYERDLQQAFVLEKKAAMELIEHPEAEPTRGVLFRSAATIALRLRRFDEAEELIQLALSGNPFGEIKNELIGLLKELKGTEGDLYNNYSSPALEGMMVREPGVVYESSQERNVNDDTLTYFTGSYYVYYEGNNGMLLEDELNISLNHKKRYYEGEYTHKPEVQGYDSNIYIGQLLFINKRVITLNLKGGIQERTEKEAPILINFYIPDKGFNLNDCECMPGIITGLSESRRIPFSRMCLLVKKSPSFARIENENVQRYFSNKNYKLTAESARFRLAELPYAS